MITSRDRVVKHLLRTACPACREPLHDTLVCAADDPASVAAPYAHYDLRVPADLIA